MNWKCIFEWEFEGYVRVFNKDKLGIYIIGWGERSKVIINLRIRKIK